MSILSAKNADLVTKKNHWQRNAKSGAKKSIVAISRLQSML